MSCYSPFRVSARSAALRQPRANWPEASLWESSTTPEILFRTLDCYRSRRFFYFAVLAAHFVPCCDARSVEYSRTLPRCASCKTQTASTIIRKISMLPAIKNSAVSMSCCSPFRVSARVPLSLHLGLTARFAGRFACHAVVTRRRMGEGIG